MRKSRRITVAAAVMAALFFLALMAPSVFYVNRNDNDPSTIIAIIGASGYIGSRLYDHFSRTRGWRAIGYDRQAATNENVTRLAAAEISTEMLATFDIVVYLGGLSGRAACDENPSSVHEENVEDIRRIAQRMHKHQTLVFASTSAVGEGSGPTPITETSTLNWALFDSYTASLAKREIALRMLSQSSSSPRMVGLRFGTVIGLSRSQRVNFAHLAMLCNAFTKGTITVSHPESFRAFLWMDDLVRAVFTLASNIQQSNRFDIFHLQSFSANIESVANSVASLTGAMTDWISHNSSLISPGFSLSSHHFIKTFNFTFQGSMNVVLSQLLLDIPKVCMGRELQFRRNNESIPCVVCGGHDLMTILDLGAQPLANDFQSQPGRGSRFPLKLMRCRQCHHAQLSHLIDRKILFSNYSYQSGTSKTLETYFEFIASKVSNETGKRHGTVFEIACNDGSQLDKFKQLGWVTYGADPAENLVKIAAAKGHVVFTGFWGTTVFPALPRSADVDAIVAQNVLAHVGDPVSFVRACKELMNRRTLLYLQTSQCEMFNSGQFDTVYHEHVSFFTAHSFKRLAELAGLHIVDFVITPIHGRSCLVTMRRIQGNVNRFSAFPFRDALRMELANGMNQDWFYLKFRARAESFRVWMQSQLTWFTHNGYEVVAAGAAAKGVVQSFRDVFHPFTQVWFSFIMCKPWCTTSATSLMKPL